MYLYEISLMTADYSWTSWGVFSRPELALDYAVSLEDVRDWRIDEIKLDDPKHRFALGDTDNDGHFFQYRME